MCGIAGFAVSGGFEENLASKEAEAMAAALSHRGPDASGVWIDSKAGIAFAHRWARVWKLESLFLIIESWSLHGICP